MNSMNDTNLGSAHVSLREVFSCILDKFFCCMKVTSN